MKARYGVAGWDALKALWWRERRLQKATLGSKKYRWFSMSAKIFVLCTLFVRGAVSTDDTLRARPGLALLPPPALCACMSSALVPELPQRCLPTTRRL
jgi:hypothetical protein